MFHGLEHWWQWRPLWGGLHPGFPLFHWMIEGDAEREREREREWASKRESERGEGKDETERGLFSWEGVVSAGNEMILEIGPRGASCPRATGHLIRDVVDLLARTYVYKSCKASLASVRARWKFFFFFFFWRGRKLKIYSYRGIWLNWKSVMVFT